MLLFEGGKDGGEIWGLDGSGEEGGRVLLRYGSD